MADFDTLEVGAGRPNTATWEIQEVVAVGLLLCLGLLFLTGVAGAVAGSVGVSNVDQVGWQQFLLHASEWAGLVAGLVLIAVLGLIWWQVDGWTDLLSEMEEAEEPNQEFADADIYDAVGHLARNRSIGTWLLAACFIVSIATVTFSIAVVSQFSGDGRTNVLVQEALLTGGQSLATLLLAVIGIVGTVRSRRTCNKVLSTTMSPDQLPVT